MEQENIKEKISSYNNLKKMKLQSNISSRKEKIEMLLILKIK